MRRYHVTTFGCQMNAHDSERIKGMLEELGLGESASQQDAHVLVFNTCTIREKPDTKFAAYIGDAIAQKRRQPDTVIAVGGCYAEAQRERLFSLYPEVDVAFGPGSIPHLGEWLGAGGFGVQRSAFGIAEERRFAAALPMHRERRFQAWVQISMGCNSKCAYCIVPAVRGREQSRRPGEVVAEVEALARDGVRAINEAAAGASPRHAMMSGSSRLSSLAIWSLSCSLRFFSRCRLSDSEVPDAAERAAMAWSRSRCSVFNSLSLPRISS